ncbi:MAG: fumarylacetoacetate hydrolase family protein [Robiginitomaculum sp.]|nr:fumarylacetoacetate hydrolase family protein [Robiginitomaculum sp.]
MRQYSILPAPIISLPIVGSDDRYPVRRIYCVGKNYKKHVAEMGGDPKKSAPVFFTKSRETIVQNGSFIPYPPQTDNLHYEVELVVALKSSTEIFGYGTAIDMTRRDIQALAKSKGGPWDMAKNFDQSAPCSALTKIEQAPDLSHAIISLRKNGLVMQNSCLNHMIWSVEEIIKHLSASVTLGAGDIILTGTPEGVGSVIAGGTIIGAVEGLASIEVSFTHG